MKVLDLTNTAASGKELLLARALYLRDRYGVENHILSMPGEHVETMREQGIAVHVVDQPRDLAPVALSRSFAGIVRVVRREKFDILHSHGSVLGLLTRMTRPLARARIVHTVHGFHFHDGMRPAKKAVYENAEKALLRLTHLTLSQNAEDAEILRGWSRTAWVEHIGNGIQITEPAFTYRAVDRDRYRLCCIARFEPVKNHAMLLDAFKRVLDAGVDAELVCMGDGVGRPEAEAQARSLGIADRVLFPGYVDIFASLADVDLNVLTSAKEGLPRAIIEPMSVGVPSVATDVKGSREVVVDGVTGLLAPLGDADAFARAVVEVLTDAERRQAMSEAGLRRTREVYDEDRICDRLYELYAELLRR